MFFRDLITDEYTGRGEDRLKNRDGFTKIIGDMIFIIPAIKTANAHRGILFTQDIVLSHTFSDKIQYMTAIPPRLDAGAPVYLYEYKHAPTFLQAMRPSFVGSDHADEIFTVFGLCFTTTHVKISGKHI